MMRTVVALTVALVSATSAGAVMSVPSTLNTASVATEAGWRAGRADAGQTLHMDSLGFADPAATRVNSDAAVPSSVVPDVMSWSLLLIGFALVGLTARRRRRSNSVTA